MPEIPSDDKKNDGVEKVRGSIPRPDHVREIAASSFKLSFIMQATLTLALSWCPVKLSKTYFRNFYMFAEKY
jgi:hypothetical protein